MKIDIFNHFLPRPYLEALGNHPVVRYAAGIRHAWDMEERLRVLEPWPEVQQVITLGQCMPERMAGPEASPRLARIANDAMAQIRDRWPQRFPAFVATLPLNNVSASLEEMDRAVEDLGACGIQLLTHVDGRPLDDEELFPVFERITSRHGLPVWMHPHRAPGIPDYPALAESRFEIWAVLGWPHESSVAMAHIVFSGMFDRLPGLRIITHHCGGTVPYLAGRVGPLWDETGHSRSDDPRYQAARERMAHNGDRPVDVFRKFYGDTAVGSAAALRCGLEFFGAERIVFATDFPYGPDGGVLFMNEAIRSVDALPVGQAERDRIYFGNAQGLVRRSGGAAGKG